MPTLTVHHLDTSRSTRILWLLEELEVDYEIALYKRDKKTGRGPKSLRQVHPLGKAPVVTTADGAVLAESGAIIEELVERYGPHLRPEPGSEAYRRYRYFMHYAEGSLMPPLLTKLITLRLRNPPVPFFLKPVSRAIAKKIDAAYTDPEIATHLGFLDSELSEQAYFAGDAFTAADIQMSFPLESASSKAGFRDHPNLAGFLERIHNRPAYKRAIEKGGELDFALGST